MTSSDIPSVPVQALPAAFDVEPATAAASAVPDAEAAAAPAVPGAEAGTTAILLRPGSIDD
ncbi:MAG: hypothetical protein J2P18_19390 [Nocardia sp.]|nr:hypothetical protein [Nocardia sp.]